MLLGLIFLVSWWRRRDQVWLLWFGIPLILAAFGSVGFTRPGWESDPLSVLTGNALRILAVAAYWQGARTFEGRRAIWWPMLLAVALWGALNLVPGFTGERALRVAATSIISAGFMAAGCLELWRGRHERLASRWPTIAVFASYALFMLARTIVSPFAPFPMGGGETDPFWFGVLMLVIIAHALLAGLLMLTMAMERQLLVHQGQSMTDQTTGLLSRRAFADFESRTNRRREGLRSSLALIVVDLDDFRGLASRHGRPFADGVLKRIANTIESSVGPADQVFRLGTDRFCVAQAEGSRAQAVATAETIRTAIAALADWPGAASAEVAVSIGLAETLHPVDVRVILSAADGALEQARRQGRNRIVVAEAATLFRAQIDDIAGPRRDTA